MYQQHLMCSFIAPRTAYIQQEQILIVEQLSQSAVKTTHNFLQCQDLLYTIRVLRALVQSCCVYLTLNNLQCVQCIFLSYPAYPKDKLFSHQIVTSQYIANPCFKHCRVHFCVIIRISTTCFEDLTWIFRSLPLSRYNLKVFEEIKIETCLFVKPREDYPKMVTNSTLVNTFIDEF